MGTWLLGSASSLLGHLWLSLCLGLRVAEASRTQALECRDNYLIIGAKASKTRSRRVIALPEGHKERYWPRNCLRHTAASHWLNFHEDEAKAALHLGHSPTMSTDTTRRL